MSVGLVIIDPVLTHLDSNHNKGEPVVAATVQTNPGDEEEGVDAIRQAGMSTAESTHGSVTYLI